MDTIGKSPLPLPVLLLGKLSMLCCWLFFFAGTLNLEMLYDAPWTRVLAFILVGFGFVVVVLGIRHLGKSISVGLSREETVLKTNGIYGLSRNPMYLGGFIISAGSCCYSIHPMNFLLFAVTVGIHHAITLKEEEFLELRFGTQWLDYTRRVPRYIGLIRVMAKTSP